MKTKRIVLSGTKLSKEYARLVRLLHRLEWASHLARTGVQVDEGALAEISSSCYQASRVISLHKVRMGKAINAGSSFELRWDVK